MRENCWILPQERCQNLSSFFSVRVAAPRSLGAVENWGVRPARSQKGEIGPKKMGIWVLEKKNGNKKGDFEIRKGNLGPKIENCDLKMGNLGLKKILKKNWWILGFACCKSFPPSLLG